MPLLVDEEAARVHEALHVTRVEAQRLVEARSDVAKSPLFHADSPSM